MAYARSLDCVRIRRVQAEQLRFGATVMRLLLPVSNTHPVAHYFTEKEAYHDYTIYHNMTHVLPYTIRPHTVI